MKKGSHRLRASLVFKSIKIDDNFLCLFILIKNILMKITFYKSLITQAVFTNLKDGAYY